MTKRLLAKLKTITPIELFAAVTVIFLIIFVVKFYSRKIDYRTVRVEVIKKNWLENYDPYGYRVPFWLSEKIKVGQTEKDSSGKIIAEVTGLENYIRSGEETEIYLTLKLLAVLNKRTGRYTYNDKPLDNGSPIELTLGNSTILGQVIDENVPPQGYTVKPLQVKVRGRNYTPAIYSKIVPGLKVYERSSNEVIAEITDVKIEDSTQTPITLENNRYLMSSSAANKDVVITAKLKTVEIDGRNIYAGHQNVKVTNKNDRLYFFTDKINLYDLEIEDITNL